MKILLFGSEGTLGNELFKPLSKKFDVTCVDFINKKKINNKNFISLDLSKKLDSNKFKVYNNDVAIILSFYKTIPADFNETDAREFNYINSQILNNALKICKISKVKKVIYFSSAAVYSENYSLKKISEKFKLKPNNIYAKFKINAEKKVSKFGKQNNIQSIIFRLFNYFTQSGNTLIKNFRKQLNKKEIFVNGNGNQSRDFLHIDDMLNAIEYFINNRVKSSTFNLCSGNGTKIKDIINALIKKGNIINYTNKNQSNFFLVGNNKKLKKLMNWKIQKNFNKFIQKL